jgi:hypothetical protein
MSIWLSKYVMIAAVEKSEEQDAMFFCKLLKNGLWQLGVSKYHHPSINDERISSSREKN